MQDDARIGLEAHLNEPQVELDQSRAERDQYRTLYLEMLERCAQLERGIFAGKKAERCIGARRQRPRADRESSPNDRSP